MIGSAIAAAIRRHIPPGRPADLLIGPNSDDPYLRRWYVIPRNHYFNIYLHHMRHDDDDGAPHDHPWWSLSLCLSGYIREFELVQPDDWLDLDRDIVFPDGRAHYVNHIRQGDWKWRSKTYAHRLTLPKGDAWTLFFTGPKARTWGFHCVRGWIPWTQFLGSDGPDRPRRGCGE